MGTSWRLLVHACHATVVELFGDCPCPSCPASALRGSAIPALLHCRGCIAAAAQPGTTAEERKKLLSFVVVGGGPSGVEVAAELHDLVAEDVVRLYPGIKVLFRYCRPTLGVA